MRPPASPCTPVGNGRRNVGPIRSPATVDHDRSAQRYNGLLEVGPDGITDAVLSTGTMVPAFQTITPNDMDESMEGELAYIPDVVFTNGGTMITGNSTLQLYGSRRRRYHLRAQRQ